MLQNMMNKVTALEDTQSQMSGVEAGGSGQVIEHSLQVIPPEGVESLKKCLPAQKRKIDIS